MFRVDLPARSQPLHDIAATRAIERTARGALPPHTLMARAGLAVTRLALALAPHAMRIEILCGPGDNGGDGLEAAAHLKQLGREVRVALLADPARHSADSREALARAQAAGVSIEPGLADAGPDAELLIDALLGIGASRAPDGPIARAIGRFNAHGARVRLAIDVPSGLHADTGRPLGEACARATHTLTMITVKPGLYTASGRDHAGSVWVDRLALEDPLGGSASSWLSGAEVADGGHRLHAQHKGSFGDLLVIGGAPGMAGAALLAARAAIGAGAGRVYVCPLDAAASAIDTTRPELMFRSLGWASSRQLLGASVVVAGCGGGEAIRTALEPLLARAASLVLDADALNAVASDEALRRRLAARHAHGLATVLTPHPLEAARLLGTDARRIQSDRLAHARRLADELQCVVLLKGSGTIIAAPAQTPHVNPTGTAALGTAGTGDVLAGWLGGTWASSARRDMAGGFAAALSAAWRHGAAANASAQSPLTATALVDALMQGHGTARCD